MAKSSGASWNGFWRRTRLRQKSEAAFFPLLFAGILAFRLCHLKIVWVEEAYPAAAALQILHSKVLYRDIWFDKPPISAWLYLLWGAHAGLPLRIAGAVFVFLCCVALYRFADVLWGRVEARAAALFLAFFLTFGVPSAVLAMAPDLLFILPHILAVYFAWRGRPIVSALIGGVALLLNAKALFLLPVLLLWTWRYAPLVVVLFATPTAIFVSALAALDCQRDYWQQVWVWGALYSTHTFLGHPIFEGIVRTLHWAGFQAALVIAAFWFFREDRGEDRRKFTIWLAISFLAVIAGWRFFPRYYFQLLPPAVLLAARGYVLLGSKRKIIFLALLIPFLRFGPRYFMLAGDLLLHREPHWSDIAMSQDSRAASQIIKRNEQFGDTLLVWGYRPDIFMDTRMAAGTPFLDSQPLTGVIADRHLTDSRPSAPALAQHNRLQLVAMSPTFIVDGLGPINPALAITNYPDLHDWLRPYQVIAKTKSCVIYERP